MRDTLGDWLSRGSFALTLSSGWFGFFAHTGMLSALESQGLRPERLSGSSAGALVAAAWAGGHDTAALRAELAALERDHFWDPAVGLGLLEGARFRRRLEQLVPASFEDCRAPVSVVAHDVLAHRARALTSGDLPRAVHASCAVPLMFHPVFIDGRPYVDGGVSDRPGISGMARDARILFHHLVSQSPWRRRGSRSLDIPARAGMVALAITGLPRCGPFRLEHGMTALDAARRATLRALDLPITAGLVRLSAGA